MTDIVKYIEGIKVGKGIKSDRQLAALVGITQPSMTNILGGLSVPKDETCVKIAELAGEDPAIVILLAHKSKASEATKKHWAKIFKLVTAATLGLVMFFYIFASPAFSSTRQKNNLTQCILCQIVDDKGFFVLPQQQHFM